MMLSVLLLLATLVWSTMESNQCTNLDQLTNLQQGERLIGYTFLSVVLKGVMYCAQACLNRKRCKSFNFKVDLGFCELNLNTSTETGGLVSTADWTYSDIDQWSKAIARDCASHTCNYNQMCLPSSFGMCHDCNDVTECGICSPVTEISGSEFQSYGCYQSSPTRVLPNLIVNLRGDIVWSNITKTILDCATEAYNTEYEFFGIEYYGECYGGFLSEANFQTPVTVNECGTKCWAGVGGQSVMFVYKWI